MSQHKRDHTPDPLLPEDTPQPQPEQTNIVPVQVRNSMGFGKVTRMRDASTGKWAKSQRSLDKEIEDVKRTEKKLERILNKQAKNKDGTPKVDEKGRPVTKLEAAADHLMDMIAELSEEKAIGSSSKALEMLLKRVYGAEKKHAQDREATRYSGIKTVMVSAIATAVDEDGNLVYPDQLSEEETKARDEERRKRADKTYKPSWADAPVIEATFSDEPPDDEGEKE